MYVRLSVRPCVCMRACGVDFPWVSEADTRVYRSVRPSVCLSVYICLSVRLICSLVQSSWMFAFAWQPSGCPIHVLFTSPSVRLQLESFPHLKFVVKCPLLCACVRACVVIFPRLSCVTTYVGEMSNWSCGQLSWRFKFIVVSEYATCRETLTVSCLYGEGVSNCFSYVDYMFEWPWAWFTGECE